MLSVTTGGAADESERQWYRNKIQAMSEEIFGYMKMQLLDANLVHGPQSMSDKQRQQALQQTAQHLQNSLDLTATITEY